MQDAQTPSFYVASKSTLSWSHDFVFQFIIAIRASFLVPAVQLLNPDEERQRFRIHRNHHAAPGLVAFSPSDETSHRHLRGS